MTLKHVTDLTYGYACMSVDTAESFEGDIFQHKMEKKLINKPIYDKIQNILLIFFCLIFNRIPANSLR